MSHPVTGKVADKVVVELIKADVDIGFALVDEAKAQRASGQPESSSRALQYAEAILGEIERRLHRLGDSGSGPLLREWLGHRHSATFCAHRSE